MHPVNLALRFLLELAALAALAMWGLRTGPNPPAAVALAVLALRQAGAPALGGMLAAAVALHQGWRVLGRHRHG